ncbi:MAG: hypothetical protein K0S61_3803 [Anaerocolumna sp.]|nr:hypothetical protein [Anaerocolumna sp.]
MIIHIVQPDETIDSIANYYGINKERLIFDNDITNYNKLVEGQTLVIVYPEEVYIVKEGDTISTIAKRFNITELTLIRNNSFLLNRELIVDEELVITYKDEKTFNLNTNGYAYPYINKDILRKNLLYLTYLSIYSYSINSDGSLTEIDDLEVIRIAKSFGVAPVMIISGESADETKGLNFLHDFINDEEIIQRVIEQATQIASEKGYYAVNLDVPYISMDDRQVFIELLTIFADRLHAHGIKLFITITPKSFGDESASENLNIDYGVIGNIADEILLISYSWGYASEIPFEALPSNILEILLEYVKKYVPAEKLTVGLSSIGYIVEFPPIKGVTKASSISVTNAIELASQSGAKIEFNPSNQNSYFFVSEKNINFFVYFPDIRAVDYELSKLTSVGVNGVGIWNIMYYLAQTFFLINTQYNIIQVIKES